MSPRDNRAPASAANRRRVQTEQALADAQARVKRLEQVGLWLVEEARAIHHDVHRATGLVSGAAATPVA